MFCEASIPEQKEVCIQCITRPIQNFQNMDMFILLKIGVQCSSFQEKLRTRWFLRTGLPVITQTTSALEQTWCGHVHQNCYY